MPTFTRAQYEQYLARTKSKANLDPDHSGLRSMQSKPDERVSLDAIEVGKEKGWADAYGRFEVVFTVYSVRPCDWDGYDIKSLQDFLVSTGIIPNDGWKTLSGRVVSCKAATQGEEKTIITIEPKK